MKQNITGSLKSKPRVSTEVVDSINKKTNVALVILGYSQAYVGLTASLFCATIILIGLYQIPEKSLIWGWYAFFICVSLIRCLIFFLYKTFSSVESRTGLWRNLFILSAVLSGVAWGFTGGFLYPYASTAQQTLIVLILAGTTAGAVPVFAPVLAAAVFFILTAIFPLVITLLIEQTNLLFFATLVAYLVFLITLCNKTHITLRNSVSLQFENYTLLSNLSEAKNLLEQINKKLEQAATHDPLTNVANRNLFVTTFAEAIERAKRNKSLLALLYIDLDNFKNVNDIHGHHIGDQMLLVLTERMEELVEAMDDISRLGGDEFTILREDITNPKEVARFAKHVCQLIAEPIRINDLELRVSASIGIGVYPIDGDDAEKLLTVADKAMYYVKERGGNNFRFNVTLLTR